MSNQIATEFSRKFASGIELLAQQLGSVCEPTVRVESATGEAAFYDQVGIVRAQEKTGSAVQVPIIDTPHARRMVTPRDFYMRDFIDKFDRMKVFNDPQNAYSEAFAAALQREKDKAIIDAALGTAFTGKQGTTAVTLPAGQQIAAGGTSFTFVKLRSAIRILRKNNAIQRGDPVTVLYTSFQEADFLNETEVKSFDYNTMKVLVEGEAGTFYACSFRRIEDITDDAQGRMLPKVSTTRSCIMYAKAGVLLAKWQDVQGKIDWIAERQAYQIYGDLSIGATRMQETKVVQIDCVEP